MDQGAAATGEVLGNIDAGRALLVERQARPTQLGDVVAVDQDDDVGRTHEVLGGRLAVAVDAPGDGKWLADTTPGTGFGGCGGGPPPHPPGGWGGPPQKEKQKKKKAPPPPPPPIEPPIEPTVALREHFVKRTAIQPNDRTGVYDRDWQQPLGQLVALAGGDVGAAVALLDRALAVARGDNERRKTYTVSCPRSLLGIASNLAATQQTAATVADDDTIWQRALAAVTRRDFTDERLKAAIRAIGGTGRIASANGHDTETLKRSLGHAYRNVAAA